MRSCVFCSPQKRDEGFALEIQNVLPLTNCGGRQPPPARMLRATPTCASYSRHSAAEHHVDGELRAGKKLFAEHLICVFARLPAPARAAL